jgi:hypothetical protein
MAKKTKPKATRPQLNHKGSRAPRPASGKTASQRTYTILDYRL